MQRQFLVFIILLVACAGFSFGILEVAADTEQESSKLLTKILDGVEKNFQVNSSKILGRLEITTSKGEKRTFSIIVYQEGKNKLVHYLKPAKVRGTSFLFLDEKIFVLHKSTMRDRQLPSHMKRMGFSDSDLSYEDLENNIFGENFKQKLLPERDEDEYRYMEIVPRKDSAYGKIIAKINMNAFFPVEVQYFDKDLKPIKKLLNMGIEKQGDKYIATKMRIINLEKDQETIYYVDEINLDIKYKQGFFSIRNLYRLAQGHRL